MSDRRQWYFEPLTPDKNSLYTLHHSQAQIRLIVAQSMSCPVSFPRHSSFHSVAESEPCLYTWWKCQHISGSSVTAVRCRKGEILSRYIKTTCKNGPKTEQHYSFACLPPSLLSSDYFSGTLSWLIPNALLVYANQSCVSYCPPTLQLEAAQECPNTILPASKNTSWHEGAWLWNVIPHPVQLLLTRKTTI